jgi:hypothetical protein
MEQSEAGSILPCRTQLASSCIVLKQLQPAEAAKLKSTQPTRGEGLGPFLASYVIGAVMSAEAASPASSIQQLCSSICSKQPLPPEQQPRHNRSTDRSLSCDTLFCHRCTHNFLMRYSKSVSCEAGKACQYSALNAASQPVGLPSPLAGGVGVLQRSLHVSTPVCAGRHTDAPKPHLYGRQYAHAGASQPCSC